MKGLKLPVAVALSLALLTGVAFAGGGSTAAVPANEAAVAGVPLGVQNGVVTASVELTQPSVAEAVAGGLSAAEQKAHGRALDQQQNALARQISALGAREVGSVTNALNAVIVSVDSSKIAALESLPGVADVSVVRDYELDLSETVPRIGASALQAIGLNGSGVVAAVLDSGIDYTHQAFGGAGTLAAYTAAYGTSPADPRNKTLDGLFPTAKVIGGWDFVGEAWPSGARAEDPDPIDCGPVAIGPPCAGGHGTHVSDIVAGQSPGAPGVAPAAKLLAYKVCSAVSTSCNGVALLLAVDAAMDPNGDGNLSDHADVINLSLGSSYGMEEDDLTVALNNAADAGAVVVTSAGNSADRPFIVGSPSIGENIISVAQTQVPSAKLYRIQAANTTVGGLHQPWSAAPVLTTGTLVYDTSNANTRRGCSDAAGANPYAPGSHAGQILLMDRGVCAVSFKVANAKAAGAIAAIVANNASQAPGDLPPVFSYGGGDASIPGYTVTLLDGNCLKGLPGSSCTSSLNLPATIDPASAASLIDTMVSSSSRGPSSSLAAIKPDIGAPGASVSAEAGTGTDETAFGGTSGAAPMVTGSAALLRQAYPEREPYEIKSVLMNTAETNIGINPIGLPGFMAPITRIGAGEVRVDRAYRSTTAAWEKDERSASLSFGYHAIAKTLKLHKRVVVRNYSNTPITYDISATFRYGDDEATGAVDLDMPSSITVPARSDRLFHVFMTVDPSKLPVWSLNGGLNGGDGYLLNTPEFDGYIWLEGNQPNSDVHLAWQVLPHRAADVQVNPQSLNPNRVRLTRGTGQVRLRNRSEVLDATVEQFALTGVSEQQTVNVLPGPGDNFAIIDLAAVGVRSSGAFVEFGIDTYGRRATPNYPAEFDIYVDSNNDGRTDYIVFNLENGGFGATGQNVVAFVRCTAAAPADPCSTTTAATPVTFTDADYMSGNVIMAVPAAAIGLAPGQKFSFSVYAFDNYFTGSLTDQIEDMTFTLGQPRYVLRDGASVVPNTFVVPAGEEVRYSLVEVPGGAAASPSQIGILLLFRDAVDSKGLDASRNEGAALVVVPF